MIIKVFVSIFVVLERENRLFFTFSRCVLKNQLDLREDKLWDSPFNFWKLHEILLKKWSFRHKNHAKKTAGKKLCRMDAQGRLRARNSREEAESFLSGILTLWQFS